MKLALNSYSLFRLNSPAYQAPSYIRSPEILICFERCPCYVALPGMALTCLSIPDAEIKVRATGLVEPLDY